MTTRGTKPFVVQSAEQLDALPLHSIVISRRDPGDVAVKVERGVIPADGESSPVVHDDWQRLYDDFGWTNSASLLLYGFDLVVWEGQAL